ncbi:MAG: hypothetical protein U1E76_27095 [Planctomycetota bacterium]
MKNARNIAAAAGIDGRGAADGSPSVRIRTWVKIVAPGMIRMMGAYQTGSIFR